MTRGLLAFLVLLPCVALAQRPATKLDAILKAARNQVGVTVTYDPSYQKLSFSGGDVPMDRGVCTDVSEPIAALASIFNGLSTRT